MTAIDDVRTFADVIRQEPLWFIKNLVQAGTVTLIGGPGGMGKSSLGGDWTGRATSGRPLPGMDAAEPTGVIMISPEDSAECSTGWRLDAAGADGKLVYDMSETTAGDFLVERDLSRAMSVVAEAPFGVGLMWIDPLSSATEISLSSPKVRRHVMKPLMRFAEQTGVAVVAVAHTTKAGILGGSKELQNCARSVLLLSEDPDDSRLRLLRLEKSNVAKLDSAPIRYRLEGEPPRTRVIYVDGDESPADGTTPLSVQACNDGPRERVLRVLGSSPLPVMRLQSIALQAGLPYPEARGVVGQLVSEGMLLKASANVYGINQEKTKGAMAASEAAV